MSDRRDLLDPAIVAQIDKLEVIARTLVQGFIRGLHASASKGSSIEFAEHRPYVPGDEIRHIDWRTYARTDRYYLKEYEDETNLRSMLIVDASASMAFGSDVTKLRYAVSLAAALGYLLLSQRDSVGLSLIDTAVRRFIPPRGTAEHLTGIFDAMERADAHGETTLGPTLHTIAERVHGGSLALVFSDLLDDPGRILAGLSHLRQRRCEVLVFHIVDPAEDDLPFDGWVVFRDMENPGETRRLDTREVRGVYRENLLAHRNELRKGCLAAGIDYVLLETDQPFENSLARFLHFRSRC